MEKTGFGEERIKELENQLQIVKECCQMLIETTPALFFRYKPAEDEMVFLHNFPDNRERKIVKDYHRFLRESASVHPDHVKTLLDMLDGASNMAVRRNITYLKKGAGGGYQWHKVWYTSVVGEEGEVERVFGRIENIHASVTGKQDMIHKIETDFLTGLHNKGAATDKIVRWLEENPEKEAHLIMLDLDDFKGVNDIYGHAFGDVVLRETGKVISECFGKNNSILSRFGGDEFIVFVMDEPLQKVEERIEKMMQKLAEDIKGMEQPLHCSVGITARLSPLDEFEDLFNRADNVMYVAKNKGKNRYFVDRRHSPRPVQQTAGREESGRIKIGEESMDKQQVTEKLASCGQEHVMKYYEELGEEQKALLLAQAQATDFSVLSSLDSLRGGNERGVITPLGAMQLPEIRQKEKEFKAIGLEAVKKGKVGAVLLAGGMGTRLGSDDPKGMYNIGITREVYIFQRLIENLMEVVREAGAFVPLYVMTSDKNHEATVKFLKEHNYFGYEEKFVTFFMQEMAPACDRDGKVYMEEKWKISTSPNGNGGWYTSMYKWGVAQKAMADGVEWLNVFAVDNVLQRIADPCFVGAVIANKCASGAKVVKKCAPDEKIGVICLEDGRPSIVEYYELTEELMNARDENGDPAYYFGVILNYLFRISDLEKIREQKLPLHLVEKKISYLDEDGNKVKPEEPNGYKFEQLVLDMIHELDSCLPFEVEREREFAPIKNKTGIDSVESARELCGKNGITL